MSYSFTVQASTPEEAKARVAEKFDQVAAQQVCHERDKAQVLATVASFIDLVQPDAARDLVVSVSGSLSGLWTGSDVTEIRAAGISVSAGLVDRKGG